MIFVNGRFLTKPVTGVQRYAREVLREMDLLPQAGKIVCLAPPEPFDPPGWTQIEIRVVGRSRGNLWEQVDLPFHARGGLLFSPANIGPFAFRNQVVTLHDASVFAVPQAYSRAFRAKYRFIFGQLARNARHLLTDSRFSQSELARYLNIPAQRLNVIAPGSDHLDRVHADPKILIEHDLKPDGYLLVVASQSAHKNLDVVFRALLTQAMDVVVVGGSFSQVFQKAKEKTLAIPANIKMLGYISDEQLKALYENALGLIFPSIYEGFGLPALEAMCCGCPVICSNAASLPEVAGDAALYFSRHDADQLAETVRRFLADSALREELRLKGCTRAGRFQWADTARRIMDVIHNDYASPRIYQ